MKFKVFVERYPCKYEIEPIKDVESIEMAIRHLSLKMDKLVEPDAIPVDMSKHYDKIEGSVYSVIGTRCPEWIRLEIEED